MNRWRFFLCDVFFFGTARKIDSQSPTNIEGTLNRSTVGMIIDSCRIGSRECLRRGAVLIRIGDMVAGEAVASGKSSGGNSWRRVMMNT